MFAKSPTPPLIPSKKCPRHNQYYPANEFCETCFEEYKIHKLLEEIIANIDELKYLLRRSKTEIDEYELDRIEKIVNSLIKSLNI